MTGAPWATLPRPVGEVLDELEVRPAVEDPHRPVDLALAAEIERHIFEPLWLGRGFYCGTNGTAGWTGDEIDVYMNMPGHDGRHTLIAGASGAGKTNAMHGIVRQVFRRRHVAVVIIDPKEIDFVTWTNQAAMLALGESGARSALGHVVAEYRARKAVAREYNRLALERGWDTITNLPIGVPILGFEFDYVLVIVDEVESLTDQDTKGHAERKELLKKLLRLGRALGIGVLLATQRPQYTVVPTAIRDLCRTRLCFGTESKDQTGVIWGDGYGDLQPYAPHKIRQLGEAFLRWDREVWHLQAAYTPAALIGADARTLPRTPGPASWPHVIDDDTDTGVCPHCGQHVD